LDQTGSVLEKLGVVEIPELTLESGKRLVSVKQVYAQHGEPSSACDNVVLVCHALTGSHHVAGDDVEGLPPAWWPNLVGPGKAIDTSSLCVICFNFLGSPYGSTSPASINPSTGRPYGMSFPVFSVRDMVRAQAAALHELGVKRLAAVVGGSLGGMQALEWAVMYPQVVERAVVIAAPLCLYPQAIAFNEVQRQAIMADPEWKGGDYYPGPGPESGLAVARMLAMITYRSEAVFVRRWMRQFASGQPWEWNGRFQVENYLHYHGEELVRRFDANCYIYLTRAMDLHDVGEGRGGAKSALSNFSGKHLLAIGITSDCLFPTWQVEEISTIGKSAGVKASYDEIESENGHDAFLIDVDQLDDMLREFWERTGL